MGPECLACFCWVCQECKLSLLSLGCISGLCLQRSALRDQVLCPLRTEGRFPQAQCFLAVTHAHSGGPSVPRGTWGARGTDADTTGFCCLLHRELQGLCFQTRSLWSPASTPKPITG